MKNNDYLMPGIAAILVAILTPLYWFIELSQVGFGIPENYSQMNFGFSNIIFLLIGILSIYIYHNLKLILHDHFNFKTIDVLLIVMIVICAIFYFGTFILDISSLLFGYHLSEIIIPWLWVGSIIVFGAIDISIAILLLVNIKKLSGLFMSFAIVNLLVGLLELSVIFSYGAIFLIPIVFIILAVGFIRKPEMLEIV